MYSTHRSSEDHLNPASSSGDLGGGASYIANKLPNDDASHGPHIEGAVCDPQSVSRLFSTPVVLELQDSSPSMGTHSNRDTGRFAFLLKVFLIRDQTPISYLLCVILWPASVTMSHGSSLKMPFIRLSNLKCSWNSDLCYLTLQKIPRKLTFLEMPGLSHKAPTDPSAFLASHSLAVGTSGSLPFVSGLWFLCLNQETGKGANDHRFIILGNPLGMTLPSRSQGCLWHTHLIFHSDHDQVR